MTHADKLIHRPIRKPRDGHIGEQVFASMSSTGFSFIRTNHERLYGGRR